MSHLTRDELLRFAEGALDASRALHLSACATCREEAESLASIVADVRSVEVPEPAPAFWDHLASRVRAAIDVESPARPTWWPAPARWGHLWRTPRLAWASAAAVVVVGVALFTVWLVHSRQADTPRSVSVENVEPATAAREMVDQEWDVVMAVADAADWDATELDALTRPGYSDLAVTELSAEEARALVRLLNDALAAGAERRRKLTWSRGSTACLPRWPSWASRRSYRPNRPVRPEARRRRWRILAKSTGFSMPTPSCRRRKPCSSTMRTLERS